MGQPIRSRVNENEIPHKPEIRVAFPPPPARGLKFSPRCRLQDAVFGDQAAEWRPSSR
jgi:hypothetical protein